MPLSVDCGLAVVTSVTSLFPKNLVNYGDLHSLAMDSMYVPTELSIFFDCFESSMIALSVNSCRTTLESSYAY